MLETLYQEVQDRKANPKEGSYTNYLFDKGIDKILKKVIASSEYQKLEVTYETDKDIIGGLILRMDDRIVDNSIRTKLDSMGRYLSQIQL